MADTQITVKYISNTGAGDNGTVQVTQNMPIVDFIKKYLSGENPDNLTIRVNGKSADLEHKLQDGERLTFGPKKVEGARRMAA